MTFRAHKASIDRAASFEALSRAVHAFEADNSLTGKDKLVLDAAAKHRAVELAKVVRAG